MSDKDSALQLINRLSDDVSLEDIMYELYFRSRVELGLRQLDAGEAVTHEDMTRNLLQWLQSAGR